MPISDDDIRQIRAYFEPMIGLPTWGVWVGDWGYLSLNFGRVTPTWGPRQQFIYGEWHLWIQSAAWALSNDNELLAATSDEQDARSDAMTQLNRHVLESVDVERPTLRLTLGFSGRLRLQTIPDHSRNGGLDPTQWSLFCPAAVISAGPGATW